MLFGVGERSGHTIHDMAILTSPPDRAAIHFAACTAIMPGDLFSISFRRVEHAWQQQIIVDRLGVNGFPHSGFPHNLGGWLTFGVIR